MTAPTNFLTIAQRAYEECGLVNNPPSAVTGQFNMAKKVVNWVLDAHLELQGEQDWRFDWAQTSNVLAANVDTIDPVATWGITVKRWEQHEQAAYIYKTATGLTSRQWLYYVDWEIFRGLNLPPITTNTPIYWTVNPQGKVIYHPGPSTADWTAVHEYYKGPETMAANGDIPRMPQKYLMAIVWKTVIRYCGNDGAPDLKQHAKEQLAKVMDLMERTELAQMLAPGSLA